MQPMTLASLSVALRYRPQKPKRSSRAKRADPDMMLTWLGLGLGFVFGLRLGLGLGSRHEVDLVTGGQD